MALFLGFQSALSYWRSAKGFHSAKPSTAMPSPTKHPLQSDVLNAPLYQLGIKTSTVHTITHAPNTMHHASGVIVHQEKGPSSGLGRTPWYYCIAKGVYAASPELCFLHLARTYSFTELLHLGFELCGSYSLDPGMRNDLTNRPPLTNPKRICEFLSSASGQTGIKKARRAGQYLIANSASPRETDLALMLCLPIMYGGYGLPKATLNASLPEVELKQALMDRSSYRPDLLWLEQRVIVEYDSDAEHSSPAKVTRDASRRNSLLGLGYNVVTVSNATIKDTAAMDRSARILSRQLHHRIRWDTINDFGTRSVWQRKVLVRDTPYWKDAEPERYF